MIQNLNPSKLREISQRHINILRWRHSDWWLKMWNIIRIKSDLKKDKILKLIIHSVKINVLLRSVLFPQQMLTNFQNKRIRIRRLESIAMFRLQNKKEIRKMSQNYRRSAQSLNSIMSREEVMINIIMRHWTSSWLLFYLDQINYETIK